MSGRRSITNPLLHLTDEQKAELDAQNERINYSLNLGRFEANADLWNRELRGQAMKWLEREGVKMRLSREVLIGEVKIGKPSFESMQQFWLDLRRVYNDDNARVFQRNKLQDEVRRWLAEHYGFERGMADLIFNKAAAKADKPRHQILASVHAQAETQKFHPAKLYGDHWALADDAALMDFMYRVHEVMDELDVPVHERSRTLNIWLGRIGSIFNHPGTLEQAYAQVEESRQMGLTGNAASKPKSAAPGQAALPIGNKSATADNKTLPSPFGGGTGSKNVSAETQAKLEESSRKSQLQHVLTGIDNLADPKPELFADNAVFMAWWNWCFDRADRLGIGPFSLKEALSNMLDVHNVYEFEGTLADAYNRTAVGLWARGKANMNDDLTAVLREDVTKLFTVDGFEADGKAFKAATNYASLSLALASGKQPQEVLQAIVDWKAKQTAELKSVTGEDKETGEKAAPSPAPTPASIPSPDPLPERKHEESDGKTEPEKKDKPKAKISLPDPDPILSEAKTLKGFPVSQLRYWLNRKHPDSAYKEIKARDNKKDENGNEKKWTSLDPDAARRRLDKVFGPQGFGWRVTAVPGLARTEQVPTVQHVKEKEWNGKKTPGYDREMWTVTMAGFVLEYAVRFAGQTQWMQTSVLAVACAMDDLGDAYTGAQSGLIKQGLKLLGGEDHFRIKWQETADANEMPEAV